MALVSKFEDEVGRGVSGYRYFAVEGNSFDPIIAELKEKKLNGDNGSFDLEKVMESGKAIPKAVEKEYQTVQTILSPELNKILKEAITKNTIPLVLPFGVPCSFEQSTVLARTLTQNKSASVAYKVQAVEKPEAFAVIVPISKDGENTLNAQVARVKKLENEQNSIDSQKIYSSFKGLMNGNTPDLTYITTLQDTFNKISNPKESRREEYDVAINKSFTSYDLEGAILQNRNTKQMYKLQALAHLFGADIGKTKLPIERMILTTKRVLRSPKREINPDVQILLNNLEKQTTGIFQQRVRAFKAELQSKL
jgi:hypothetical protein